MDEKTLNDDAKNIESAIYQVNNKLTYIEGKVNLADICEKLTQNVFSQRII